MNVGGLCHWPLVAIARPTLTPALLLLPLRVLIVRSEDTQHS